MKNVLEYRWITIFFILIIILFTSLICITSVTVIVSYLQLDLPFLREIERRHCQFSDTMADIQFSTWVIFLKKANFRVN